MTDKVLLVIAFLTPLVWAIVPMSEKHQRSMIVSALTLIAAAIWRLKP